MLEAPFLEFFKQTVTIARFAGNDPDGAPQFHTPVTLKARIAGATRRMLTDSGEVVTADQAIYLPTDIEITDKDQITLPEGFEPRTPPILGVKRYPDETGAIHHITILV